MMKHVYTKFTWVLILVSSIVLAGYNPSVFAASTNFSDFSDLSAFTLNGASASIHGGGPVLSNGKNVLRLTSSAGVGGISGSAFLTNPFLLESDGSFNTVFEFQISNSVGIGEADGVGGDGFMFVLQTQGANALGTGGGYLGFGHGLSSEPSSIQPSFGIEFDTFNNGNFSPGFADPILDTDGNHVGVNLGGSLVSVATAPVVHRLNNGLVWHTWIDYDGTTDLLEIRLSETATRPTSPLLSHTVDLISVLGSPNIYAGFTAGIASARNDHDIRSWQFNSTPTAAVPEPSSILLLSTGMLGLMWYRRKCSWQKKDLK